MKLRDACVQALRGVGDVSLGEWHEWTGVAYHIRRRLSKAEQAHVGDANDIRGTPEESRRLGAWAARIGEENAVRILAMLKG